MISELLIAAFTLVLGMYWFRHNCAAILKTKASREKAQQVAAANQLGFVDVLVRLDEPVHSEEFRGFNETLLRDYSVLTALLRYSSTLPNAGYAVEERLLMLDFRILEAWYMMVSPLFSPLARRSLAERGRILVHFANRMSERSAGIARA